MIKLTFIIELGRKVETAGILSLLKKYDIIEMMTSLTSLLILYLAFPSTDSLLDTSVASSGRC